MANFARLRASGLWVPGSTVLQGELEEWDLRWTKTINGTEGSTHAPTSQIVIGGSGFAVPAPAPSAFGNVTALTASGTATFNGALNATSTVNLSGISTINDATFQTGCRLAGTTDITYVTPRSYTRACRGVPDYDPLQWTSNYRLVTPIFVRWRQDDVVTGEPALRMTFDVDVPDGCTITGFSWTIDPVNTHVGLPTNMPRMELYESDVASGAAATLISGFTDNSASTAAYHARHTLAVTGLSWPVDYSANTYFIQVIGEYGPNAVANMQALVPTVTFSTTGVRIQ